MAGPYSSHAEVCYTASYRWPRHSSPGVSLVGGRARKGAIDDMDEMKDPRVPEGMRAVILIGPGVLRLCRVTSHETAVDKDFFARLAM